MHLTHLLGLKDTHKANINSEYKQKFVLDRVPLICSWFWFLWWFSSHSETLEKPLKSFLLDHHVGCLLSILWNLDLHFQAHINVTSFLFWFDLSEHSVWYGNGISYSKYKNNHTDLVIVIMKAQATDIYTWVVSKQQVDTTQLYWGTVWVYLWGE